MSTKDTPAPAVSLEDILTALKSNPELLAGIAQSGVIKKSDLPSTPRKNDLADNLAPFIGKVREAIKAHNWSEVRKTHKYAVQVSFIVDFLNPSDPYITPSIEGLEFEAEPDRGFPKADGYTARFVWRENGVDTIYTSRAEFLHARGIHITSKLGYQQHPADKLVKETLDPKGQVVSTKGEAPKKEE